MRRGSSSCLRSLLLGIGLAALIATMARADYLEVRRSATIRSEPASGSPALATVEPSTWLPMAGSEQVQGYYPVTVPGIRAAGWVYRTFVRRYPGPVPTPEAVSSGVPPPVTGSAPWASRHIRLGKPVAVYERFREGYALAEDARLKIPLWDQYELSQQDLSGAAARTDDFRPDTSIATGARAELKDYAGSGLDRGHMAPAADMNRSHEVMSESFLLSNMCPQDPTLNRGLWAKLEEAVRGWVRQRGTLTIVTGPVFAVQGDRVSYRVVGADHVAVPTHFYKIVLDSDGAGGVQALAFLVPNARPGAGAKLADFLVSVDDIEAATGLDFFSELPDTVEAVVERQRAGGLW